MYEYDGLLILQLPSGIEIIGLADDVFLTVTGEMLEQDEILTAEPLDTTDVVLISNREAVQSVNINVGEHEVALKRALKHLGLMVDRF